MIPSKEVMQTDLENTEKETKAYLDILNGYKVLQSLPENSPKSYQREIMKFESSHRECAAFLERLKKFYSDHYGNQEVPNE